MHKINPKVFCPNFGVHFKALRSRRYFFRSWLIFLHSLCYIFKFVEKVATAIFTPFFSSLLSKQQQKWM